MASNLATTHRLQLRGQPRHWPKGRTAFPFTPSRESTRRGTITAGRVVSGPPRVNSFFPVCSRRVPDRPPARQNRAQRVPGGAHSRGSLRKSVFLPQFHAWSRSRHDRARRAERGRFQPHQRAKISPDPQNQGIYARKSGFLGPTEGNIPEPTCFPHPAKLVQHGQLAVRGHQRLEGACNRIMSAKAKKPVPRRRCSACPISSPAWTAGPVQAAFLEFSRAFVVDTGQVSKPAPTIGRSGLGQTNLRMLFDVYILKSRAC